MHVRDARSDDAATVTAIARESWHAAYDDIIGPETVDERIGEWYALDSLAEDIANAAGRADATFLVCERTGSAGGVDETRSATVRGDPANAGSAVVGFAHAGQHPDLAGTAKLSRLYARPRVWGDGVGSRLLERVERGLHDHFETLRVEVLADNDVGVSFYETSGFERVGEQKSVLGDDAVGEYLYEKGL